MESSRATEAGREQVPDYVLSRDSFLELLAHERACSERSGSPFAVLAFQVDGQPMGDFYEVPYTEGEGHVFDFAATGLPSANLTVLANLQSDAVPVYVQADVVVKP